jgi:hypothetical protein
MDLAVPRTWYGKPKTGLAPFCLISINRRPRSSSRVNCHPYATEMTQIPPSASALAPVATRRTLQDAIRDFQSVLNNDQRRKLQVKAVPDVDAVIIFTAQLDYCNRIRKGPSIASRLFSVLRSIRDFSAVVDTFVLSRLEVASLVWGIVKLTMLVSSTSSTGDTTVHKILHTC